MMSPMQSFASVMRKYTSMEGRASRSEYWWFFLISTFAVIAIAFIEAFVAMGSLETSGRTGAATGIATTIAMLFFLVPSITVSVRRLHDLDKSGLWWFVNFIPVIGGIWYLILMIWPGNANRNSFGLPPGSTARPMGNAYATLYKPDAEEAVAVETTRKEEISDYYRKHVLGQA